jgi:hypothetical protein
VVLLSKGRQAQAKISEWLLVKAGLGAKRGPSSPGRRGRKSSPSRSSSNAYRARPASSVPFHAQHLVHTRLISSCPHLLLNCLAQIDSHGCSTFYPIVGRIILPFRLFPLSDVSRARGQFSPSQRGKSQQRVDLVHGHPLMAIRTPLCLESKTLSWEDCSYDSHYSPPSLLRVPRVVCAPRRSIQRCSRQRPGRSPTRSRGVRARRASACV